VSLPDSWWKESPSSITVSLQSLPCHPDVRAQASLDTYAHVTSGTLEKFTATVTCNSPLVEETKVNFVFKHAKEGLLTGKKVGDLAYTQTKTVRFTPDTIVPGASPFLARATVSVDCYSSFGQCARPEFHFIPAAATCSKRLQKPVVRQGFQDAAKAQNFRGGVEILP